MSHTVGVAAHMSCRAFVIVDCLSGVFCRLAKPLTAGYSHVSLHTHTQSHSGCQWSVHHHIALHCELCLL